jgi:hypothetical protein
VQDVEVPARVDIAGERSARPAGLLGTGELRPLVVVAAFVVAILLGVGIGYVTANRGPGSGGADVVSGVPAPELTPAQRPAPWSASRQPGTAHQMVLTVEPNPVALRLALQWTVADQIRKAGGPGTITANQVTVLGGMYFGAVEGVDAAHDDYWAIGRVEVAGLSSPPADPHVWRRIGSGPWSIVRNGPGACDAIPGSLVAVWKGQPPPCTG